MPAKAKTAKPVRVRRGSGRAQPAASPPAPRRACVIGAGLGGLALAIRLQAAGLPTVLVEARPEAGGRAQSFEHGGFRFDHAPLTLAEPTALLALWALPGADPAEAPQFAGFDPAWRCYWPDGGNFDVRADQARLREVVARVDPDDTGGFDALVERDRDIGEDARAHATGQRRLPTLLRARGWRSRLAGLAAHLASDRLVEALAADALIETSDPLGPVGTAMLLPPVRGLWSIAGGGAALVGALTALYARLGGELRLHDPAVRIHTLGNRATEVEARSGWRERFTLVASTIDPIHTARDLLHGEAHAAATAARLARRRWGPAMVALHFALEGNWPGIPPRSVLMGPRFAGLLSDIWEHGVLPHDLAFGLDHPSLTDPTAAPLGKSAFTAWVPVAHRGKLPLDWEPLGRLIEERVLGEIGRRLVPDLDDRLLFKVLKTPRDFALDFDLWQGSMGSLQPALGRRGWQRLAPHDPTVANLWYAGAATHGGGARVETLLAGAEATARLMLEAHKR